MTRRDLLGAALVALTLAATLPAYGRVFTDTAWRAPALLAAAIAIALALALRALRRGVVLSLVVSIVVLAGTLPWLLGLTSRPVVPGFTVLGDLRELLEIGLEELAATPAPAATTAGLSLLVVAGWWVIAHVATEAIVRIRRPGAGLVAIAVLWVAPLVVPMSSTRVWPTAVPFLAAVALVLLLVRPDDDPGAPRRERTLEGSGLALGAVAIVVATLVPGLLPGYGASAWVGVGVGSAPRGYQPIVDISERLREPNERDVLRVRASQRSYLRLAGLDTFDGSTWRLGPPDADSYRPDPENLYAATDVLPPEAPTSRSEPVVVEVDVLALENIYVPVPYQPVTVQGPQAGEMVWSTDGGFLATWNTVEDDLSGELRVGIREGVSYRVEAARPAPDYEELLVADTTDPALARHTELPREYEELRELALSIYEEAGATTAVDQALALQDWFTGPAGGFTYDLDVPALRGDDALTDFVLEDRVGYCEYFATAMAVMLRATGIPARVAVGFLPGRVTEAAAPEQGRDLTEFTVSTADAHAWVEVLFPGNGWVTFEPTPRDDSSQVVPTADDLAPIENLQEREAREAAERGDDPSDTPDAPTPADPSTPDDLVPPELGEQPDSGAVGGGSDGDREFPLAVAVLAAVVLLGGVVATVVVRSRRQRTVDGGDAAARIVTAQRQLLTTAASVGLARRQQETVREVVARWAAERRVSAPDAAVLDAIQAAAFGGRVDDAAADAVADWVERASGELRASVSRRDRAVAPIRVPVTAAVDGVRRGGTALRERADALAGPADDRRR